MNARRKVLYIVTKSVWGGAQAYVYDLATNIPSEEYTPVVAAGGDGPLIQKLQAQNVKTVQIKAFQRDINIFKEAVSLFELFSLIAKERPDVVHVNSSKAGGLGAVAARALFVRRVIFTSHGLTMDEKHRSFISKTLIHFFTWLTMVFAHTTIMISKSTYEEARAMWFVGRKVVHIYNGKAPIQFVDREKARAEIAKIGNMPKETLEDGAFWIGTIGELHPNKNYPMVIEAFAKIAATRDDVYFVGISEGELRDQLEEMIEKNGLTERFFLPGFIDNAPTYLQALNIFTLTSNKEGHPYVLIEAGQARLPAIGTDIRGITDIIEHGATGLLVPPSDVGALANAMTSLLENPDKRKEFGRNLRTFVNDRFSLQGMMNRTVATY